jgi:uncharacterized protein (TIGR02001 family)
MTFPNFLFNSALAVCLFLNLPSASAQVTTNVTLQSDYIFRGISQTSRDPALQGSINYSDKTGFYAGVWASNVEFNGPENVEIDLYAGWATTLKNGLGLNISIAEYLFFGHGNASDSNAREYLLNLSHSGFGVTYSTSDVLDNNVEFSYTHSFNNQFSLATTYGDFDSYKYYRFGISRIYKGTGFDLSYWDTDIDNSSNADGRLVLTISRNFGF